MNREIIINRSSMDLSKHQLFKHISDILKHESSANSTQVIFSLNKQHKQVSDLTMNKLCRIFIHTESDVNLKLSTLKAIDALINNGEKVTNLCIKVLETALNDEKFEEVAAEIFLKTNSELNQTSTNYTVNDCHNFLLWQSFDILEKSSRNGIRLQDKSLFHLINLASRVSVKERIKIMKIFKNLSENLQISNSGILILSFLENSLSDSELAIQKLAINSLKNIIDYKPTKTFFNNLDKILEHHPLKQLLKQSLKVSVQKFLHIIHVMLSVDRHACDFQSKPVDLICRELLCHHLLAHIKNHDDYDKLSEFKFYLNLTKLEKHFKNENFSIFCDDILLFFIENDEQLKLNEINNMILSMSLNFYDTSN